MNKIVIIINGKGGSGKDTFCDAIAKEYKTLNVSSITPIKELALKVGWDGVKDAKGRRFLADLKEAFTLYCDLPNRYLMEQYGEFLRSDDQVMFVHIREESEIDRFKAGIDIPCRTLLVTRPSLGNEAYGNASDDLADTLTYDYTFLNDCTREEFDGRAVEFFGRLLSSEGI